MKTKTWLIVLGVAILASSLFGYWLNSESKIDYNNIKEQTFTEEFIGEDGTVTRYEEQITADGTLRRVSSCTRSYNPDWDEFCTEFLQTTEFPRFLIDQGSNPEDFIYEDGYRICGTYGKRFDGLTIEIAGQQVGNEITGDAVVEKYPCDMATFVEPSELSKKLRKQKLDW